MISIHLDNNNITGFGVRLAADNHNIAISDPRFHGMAFDL